MAKIYMVVPNGDGYDDETVGLAYANDPEKAIKIIGKRVKVSKDELKYYSAFELNKAEYELLLKRKAEELQHAEYMYNLFKQIY
jgi:hypothetical protein